MPTFTQYAISFTNSKGEKAMFSTKYGHEVIPDPKYLLAQKKTAETNVKKFMKDLDKTIKYNEDHLSKKGDYMYKEELKRLADLKLIKENGLEIKEVKIQINL